MKNELQLLSTQDLESGIVAQPDEVILINDTQATEEWLNKLSALISPTCLIADAELLTTLLLPQLSDYDLNVFPGNGAKQVQRLLASDLTGTNIAITANRKRQNSRPKIEINKFQENMITANSPDFIAIIDDVVCTGNTLEATRFAINWVIAAARPESTTSLQREDRGSLFDSTPPQREYIAIAWLELITSNRNLDRFTELISASTYQGNGQRPALNSLSTLTKPGRKSKNIREQYARKYADNPNQLINFLGGK